MLPLLVYSLIAVVLTLLNLEKHYLDRGQMVASLLGEFTAYLLLVTLVGEGTRYYNKRRNRKLGSK